MADAAKSLFFSASINFNASLKNREYPLTVLLCPTVQSSLASGPIIYEY